MTAAPVRPTHVPQPHRARLAPKGSRFLAMLHTTDLKQIAFLYLVTSFAFFMVGAAMAMLIRAEVARPGLQFLSTEQWHCVLRRDRHRRPVAFRRAEQPLIGAVGIRRRRGPRALQPPAQRVRIVADQDPAYGGQVRGEPLERVQPRCSLSAEPAAQPGRPACHRGPAASGHVAAPSSSCSSPSASARECSTCSAARSGTSRTRTASMKMIRLNTPITGNAAPKPITPSPSP